MLETTDLLPFIAPCTSIPCNEYFSENISDLQVHKQLKCLNIPSFASTIALNVMHFLLSSSLIHVSSHCACPHIQLAYTWRSWLTTPVMGRLEVVDNALSDHFPASVWSTTFYFIFQSVSWPDMVKINALPLLHNECICTLHITNSLHFTHNNFIYTFINIYCKMLCTSCGHQSEQSEMENTQDHYQL